MTTLFHSKEFYRRRLAAAAAGIMLALLAAPVGALSLCAATAQDLHDDLAKASDNGLYAGEDVEINLVKGTYHTGDIFPNGLFAYSSTASTGHIIVSGGWSVNCDSFSPDASTTVLDGDAMTPVLSIYNSNNDIDVEFLTIQNGASAHEGGAVALASTGGAITLSDNIIQNNHMNGEAGGFYVETVGQIAVEGNLVVGNSSGVNYGAGLIISLDGIEARFSQNTVYNNTTTVSGGVGGVSCCGFTGTTTVTANILWDNANFGINFQGTPADFEFNDVGAMTGVTPSPNLGNVSVTPKFADATNQNFRLAGDSPLLAVYAAAGSFRSTDLAGDAYAFPALGYFDIGAYEDTVFTDHGFEGK